jgi:hypothetical protein
LEATFCHFKNFLLRLKYFGDHTYEIEGFTTSMKSKPEEIESLCTPNSGKIKNLIEIEKNNFFLRWTTTIKSRQCKLYIYTNIKIILPNVSP